MRDMAGTSSLRVVTFLDGRPAHEKQTRGILQALELLTPVRSAVDWFLGANKLNKALYNFSTGGCHDALTASGINNNQGTEATIYCLMAFLSLNNVIGIDDAAGQTKILYHEIS